jgi:hypothetical protein
MLYVYDQHNFILAYLIYYRFFSLLKIWIVYLEEWKVIYWTKNSCSLVVMWIFNEEKNIDENNFGIIYKWFKDVLLSMERKEFW